MDRYKTKLCKHFINDKHCPLFELCQFAHGDTELRKTSDVSFNS